MVNMTFADAMAMFAKHEDTGIVTQLMNKVNGIYNKMVALGSKPEIKTTEITDMNIEQTIDKLLAATGEEAVALRKVLVDAYKQTEIITPEDVIAENAIAVAIIDEKLKAVQVEVVNLTTDRDQWKTKAEALGAKPAVDEEEIVAGDDKMPNKKPVAANPWDTAKEEVVAKAEKQAKFRKAAALVD
jgi:regulator of RNase E activity RraB